MVGKFGPAIVRELSLKEHIPSTFMFMGSFGEKFEYTFTEMGGLRLITENTATYYQPTSVKSKADAAAKIQAIFRRNKVKKRFSALVESPRSASPPLSKNHESKILINKVGAAGISSPGDNDTDEGIIRVPSQQSFHVETNGSNFNLDLNRHGSFTTDDVVLEMSRRASSGKSSKSLRKMSD